MDGYKESSKIEQLANELLEKNPITKDNVFEWTKYARTLKTTFDIILEECQFIIREQFTVIGSDKKKYKNNRWPGKHETW